MPIERPHLIITREQLQAITDLLADVPVPWMLSGGWAIDGFIGRETRRHEDVEIGIPRAEQRIAHDRFPSWRHLKIAFDEANEPQIVPWEQGEHLELPIHQVILQRDGFQPPEFEFFLNDVEDGEWYFRRDRRIHRPLTEVIAPTSWGIPVVAPEVQLLYKSRLRRPKDEADFENVLPAMDTSRREWLRRALAIHRPDDPWIARLT